MLMPVKKPKKGVPGLNAPAKKPKKRTLRIPRLKTPSAAAAELERQRLTSLINSMADAVVALDGRQRIVMSNAAALDIFDVNRSLDGRALRDVFAPRDNNNQAIDISRVLSDCTTQFTTRDWRLYYTKDDYIDLYVSIAPVQLGYGHNHTSGWVLLMRDITREKSFEEERDEFISVVSHELRTPIAISEGNVGNAEFMYEKSGIKNPAIKQALKQAHDQINFLSGLINDLATLSRAERGKLEIDVEPINAHQLCETLATDYTAQAAAKKLDFVLELDPGLELLQSSRLYVREILQNFITNAIKYTITGRVTLSAKPTDKGVQFMVSDTGIGINKSDQEKIFDKFFRSEDFHTREQSGTGLGLYVTMKLARLIHAEIELDSVSGKGSTFTIFVPNLQ